MLNSYVLFNNLFRSSAITPQRLYGFGIVVLQALISANDKKQFDTIISDLTANLALLKAELSDVDTNLNEQKTETQTVDGFIVGFYQFMSDSEPFIARLLGGRTSAGYLAFYPYGQSEYSNVTKTTMPTLTARVRKAAVKYGDKLDPDMVETLQAFDPDFEKQYGTQQTQINTVKQDRAEKNSAFTQTGLSLTNAVYSVGLQYTGDVAKCDTFFPFHMLYSKNKKKVYTLADTLQKSQTNTVLNRVLTKNVRITLRNTGDGAAYAFWMAASSADPMPADAYIMQVGSNPLTLRAGDDADFQNKPFIMVKNMSDVNECSYSVSFAGLRTPIKNAVASTDMEIIDDEEEKAS